MNPYPLHLCSNCFELRNAHTDDEVASCPFAPTTFKLLLFTPFNEGNGVNADTIRAELQLPSAQKQLEEHLRLAPQ